MNLAERDGTIRTIPKTGSAADADPIVVNDCSVGGFVHSAGGAGLNAHGVFTVIAGATVVMIGRLSVLH